MIEYTEYTVKVSEYKTEWWLNGKLHREDGPAVEYTDGAKCWYLNDKRHREDGPAIEDDEDGTTEWFLNGKRHREGGPAVEYADGYKYWYIHGDLHREDGPAAELADGINDYKEWYLNGVKYSEEEFNFKMNPVKELTVAEIEKLLGYKVKVVK